MTLQQALDDWFARDSGGGLLLALDPLLDQAEAALTAHGVRVHRANQELLQHLPAGLPADPSERRTVVAGAYQDWLQAIAASPGRRAARQLELVFGEQLELPALLAAGLLLLLPGEVRDGQPTAYGGLALPPELAGGAVWGVTSGGPQ